MGNGKSQRGEWVMMDDRGEWVMERVKEVNGWWTEVNGWWTELNGWWTELMGDGQRWMGDGHWIDLALRGELKFQEVN